VAETQGQFRNTKKGGMSTAVDIMTGLIDIAD
jgi:hypothetical protein